ncbi:MAG: ABC transporter ATP-binding protein [Eubacterium sp.]|nr:ABC transporter ATP-binding protein [Eubacterium sp.]
MSGTLLEVRHVSKSYQDGEGKKEVLRDVSIQVAAGEIVAILGPSGSGKSTFLSIAGMLLSPDEGEVYIAGEDVSSLPRSKWVDVRKNRIGFIFQNHQLLPYLKTKDQLDMFQSREYKSVVNTEDLLGELDITSCRNKYPSKMSGGEKQRTAIARALINDPDIILADEPTASLDAKHGHKAVEMIRDAVKKRGKAAIIVTHDERILDLMDRIYRLENGMIII